MGVQTTQALAIGAGIGGLSRIWLAAWMGTLPDRNSVEMAGAVCVWVCSSQRQETEGGGHRGRDTGVSTHPVLDCCLYLGELFPGSFPGVLGHSEEANTNKEFLSPLSSRTMSVLAGVLEVQELRPCWSSPAERREVELSPSEQPDSGIPVSTLSVRGRSRAAACVCTSHLSSLGQAAAWCRLRPT